MKKSISPAVAIIVIVCVVACVALVGWKIMSSKAGGGEQSPEDAKAAGKAGSAMGPGKAPGAQPQGGMPPGGSSLMGQDGGRGAAPTDGTSSTGDE